MSANFLTDAPCCKPTVVQGDDFPCSMLQINVVRAEFTCTPPVGNFSSGIKCAIIVYNDKHVHHSKHLNALYQSCMNEGRTVNYK